MFIEVWTDKYPITFDGTVVEAFVRESNRWHVTMVKEISLQRGSKGDWQVTISASPYGGISGNRIPDESLPGFRQLIAEVNRVRDERYALAPVTS